MSKFYAAGLRRLADALEAEPIEGDKYPGTTPDFQISVATHADVIAAAARFGVEAEDWDQGWCATADFGGVRLNVYAIKEPTP